MIPLLLTALMAAAPAWFPCKNINYGDDHRAKAFFYGSPDMAVCTPLLFNGDAKYIRIIPVGDSIFRSTVYSTNQDREEGVSHLGTADTHCGSKAVSIPGQVRFSTSVSICDSLPFNADIVTLIDIRSSLLGPDSTFDGCNWTVCYGDSCTVTTKYCQPSKATSQPDTIGYWLDRRTEPCKTVITTFPSQCPQQEIVDTIFVIRRR